MHWALAPASIDCSYCVAPLRTCRYTTHLVVRLDANRRLPGAGSGKTLYAALLYGVAVVDVGWLTASIAQGAMLPVDSYLAQVRPQDFHCWQTGLYAACKMQWAENSLRC